MVIVCGKSADTAKERNNLTQFYPPGHSLFREGFYMDNCLITFRSVTPAQRGDILLRRQGFRCSLRRTPRWMEEQGCGYSVQVRYEDVANCVALLRNNKVPYRKVYLLRQDAKAEELSV